MSDSGGTAWEQRQEQVALRVRQLRAVAFVALVALLGVGLYLIASGVDLCSLATVGLPGLSLVMFLSSATVFLPAPGIAAVGLAGTTWHPALVGLFAAVGSAGGELTGYMVGYGGRRALGVPKGRWWEFGEKLMRRWGFVFVLLFAAFPNPFFDVVGILAGSLGYPARKLVVAIFLGNFAKYGAAALLGGMAIGERGC